MTTIFGIKNCDTVRKARKWLETNNVEHTFHDFREDGLSEEQVKRWVQAQGWEAVLNKRSTSFRNLDENDKTNLTETKAISLMLEHPTLIKRPVLQTSNSITLGFKADTYQGLF
ncbi:ArsC family reductase [Parashewanella curva]|uniref:ArsC family reductase n=1 Tax=Parashewanella curva TaxID=2338552 RepID=A0A3L8PXT9_9GAMM|nr:ArsC family reductase [Parashewanella curva]RLV59268.1 ArsC family reductase [Parashewanella curva]